MKVGIGLSILDQRSVSPSGLILPGTPLWTYDPASLSALSDGDNVAAWDDETGLLDLTSAATSGATYRDGIITAGPNAQPFVQFVAAAKALSKDLAAPIFTSDDVSQMLVIRADNQPGTGVVLQFTKSVSDANFIGGIRFFDSTGDKFQFNNRISSGDDKFFNSTAQTHAQWYVIFHDTHATTHAVEVYVDDPVTADNTVADIGNDIVYSNAVIRRVIMGARNEGTGSLSESMSIALSVGWQGNLSTADRAIAMNNAKTFFGI